MTLDGLCRWRRDRDTSTSVSRSLGRTGAAELTDPARAGGAVSENATETPRRRRRDVTLTAPVDMRPFAMVVR